jgi:hypothetical protein
MPRKSVMAPEWSRMPLQKRLKIALAVARRRGTEFARQYRGVLSVGAGFRLRKGQPVAEDVCLRILVKKKGKRPGRHDVPCEIRTYISHRGRRSIVRIPTDVSELSEGRPHTNLTGGIVTQDSSGPLEYGSACCIVKDKNSPADKYLLTCHHVVSPSMQAVPGPLACLDCSTNLQIADYDAAANSFDPGGSLDAALLATSPGVVPIDVWGHVITGKASDADLTTLTTTTPLWVLVRRIVPNTPGVPPRQNALPATFHTVWPSRTYAYPAPASANFTFADTIEYAAATAPGDSGSAVIGEDGTLFGMHFFADATSSYALSAPRLFDSGAFSIDIWLN